MYRKFFLRTSPSHTLPVLFSALSTSRQGDTGGSDVNQLSWSDRVRSSCLAKCSINFLMSPFFSLHATCKQICEENTPIIYSKWCCCNLWLRKNVQIHTGCWRQSNSSLQIITHNIVAEEAHEVTVEISYVWVESRYEQNWQAWRNALLNCQATARF